MFLHVWWILFPWPPTLCQGLFESGPGSTSRQKCSGGRALAGFLPTVHTRCRYLIGWIWPHNSTIWIYRLTESKSKFWILVHIVQLCEFSETCWILVPWLSEIKEIRCAGEGPAHPGPGWRSIVRRLFGEGSISIAFPIFAACFEKMSPKKPTELHFGAIEDIFTIKTDVFSPDFGHLPAGLRGRSGRCSCHQGGQRGGAECPESGASAMAPELDHNL